MKQVDVDIKKTQDVRNIIYSQKYGKVYFKTNEFLEELFKNVDLKDKDILTVLGSGDQSFLCYEKQAKSVDVFDINLDKKYNGEYHMFLQPILYNY